MTLISDIEIYSAIVVSTALVNDSDELELGMETARKIGCPFFPRRKKTISQILSESGAEGALIVSSNGIVYHTKKGRYAYHPNIAAIRYNAIQQTGYDRLIDAGQITKGDRVLDCTCGFAADSIICSYVVGAGGTVTALEKSSVLAVIIEDGLARYSYKEVDLVEAMRRIKVIHTDYTDFLKSCDTSSWDVILFDPMFDESIGNAVSFQLVQHLGHKQVLNLATLREARRVARRKVVVKDRLPGKRLRQLSIPIIPTSKRVCYGRIAAL